MKRRQKKPKTKVVKAKIRKGTIAQNHHGILTLTELFKPGCVYKLICVETSCEATAAFWLMSSWHVMTITGRGHGIKYLSIIIDHMAEFKKLVQCSYEGEVKRKAT